MLQGRGIDRHRSSSDVRWSGSPVFWGVRFAVVEHAHCNTTLASTQILRGGEDRISSVKVVDRWKEENPTTVPADAKIRAHRGGGRHSDDNTIALTASASLASNHVRMFWPGETGVTPVLAPKKS